MSFLVQCENGVYLIITTLKFQSPALFIIIFYVTIFGATKEVKMRGYYIDVGQSMTADK